MSAGVAQVLARRCAWCGGQLPSSRATYCSQRCRQWAFRLRRRRSTELAHGRRMRMAYADPPYPGLSSKYYRNEPTYAGEVDHRELIGRLMREFPDGWALSTSAEALADVLALCPRGVRVCPWVKPKGVPKTTKGIHNSHEYVLVYGGRQRPPGVRDFLIAMPARHGGDLPGRKPIAFCAWLFDLLGLETGDELVDLFPGTGIVGRCWAELSRRASPEYSDDASSGDGVYGSETSLTPAADGFAIDPEILGKLNESFAGVARAATAAASIVKDRWSDCVSNLSETAQLLEGGADAR
jgi:hypothetical protein